MLVARAGAAELNGLTTVQQRIAGDGAPVFQFLDPAAGETYLVRDELGKAQPGRTGSRTSLIYFGQLSDFQLADEESPARVEFFDSQPAVNFSSSGHRPQEALTPHQVEAMIRQMNSFDSSPVPQGNGSFAPLDNVIATGDLADSMQRNETEWVLTLLEGGSLNPGSGTATLDPACTILSTVPGMADLADPSKYTGVQDYDDYTEAQLFYDPETPVGPFAGWPSYPNLQDRAQVPFTADGLDVPSYVAVGNHDVLVQGNEDANAGYETTATGCVKPMGPFSSASPDTDSMEDVLDPAYLTGLLTTDPAKLGVVPPDANRQYADKEQQRGIYMSGAQADDHGFAFVDPTELTASGGTAMYYSFSPQPGIRFIALDTNTSGAGLLVDPTTQDTTAEGNLDDPQFQWLTQELDAAEAAGELVVTYAHHASQSMDFTQPDELAAPCTTDDAHGHDVNPGCDADPRSSSPIHTSQGFIQLLTDHENVIAHVAGHSHDNSVTPHPRERGGGWWEIRSPAIADWPAQSRLLEVMDNNDGTLSIFGTLIDHDSPVSSPASGTDTSAATVETLASLGRTISFNDSQVDQAGAEGGPEDRNVELLLDDPRGSGESGRGTDAPGSAGGGPGGSGAAQACTNTVRGRAAADKLSGTAGNDLMLGRRGNDRIRGLAGDDCVRGGSGRDRIKGGPGNDRLRGGAGSDVIKGGPGTDFIRCGGGKDLAKAGPGDRVKGCERVRR